MAQLTDGCVKPAKGPLLSTAAPAAAAPTSPQEVPMIRAQVGKPAIDFEANAFIEGTGFKTVKLSDYRGKWIVLCFYPGDFTFV